MKTDKVFVVGMYILGSIFLCSLVWRVGLMLVEFVKGLN